MNRSYLTALAIAASLTVGVGVASAEKKAKESDKSAKSDAKTITGTSACATCEGVTAKGHQIMLKTADGTLYVLEGSGEHYKAAHKVRTDGKKMTATLASEATEKKTDDGKAYKEAKISDIKVEA